MTQQEKRQYIIEQFPVMSGSEIGERIGLSRNYVNAVAKKLGIVHTEAAWERLKRKRADMALAARDKDTYKKSSVTRRKTYRKEMMRLLSGQKKETKLVVSVLPLKCRRRMIMLCNVFNYFRDADINKAVVYYDKETRRSESAEQYASSKYGIKFIDAS